MNRTRLMFTAIALSLCLLLSIAQSTTNASANIYGTACLPESQKGIQVQTSTQHIPKDYSRVHQYNIQTSLTLKDPIGQDQNIRNQYYISFFEEDPQNQLCFRNNFKKCLLAVGHGYQTSTSDQTPNLKEPKTVTAYLGYSQDNNFNIAFESNANENWRTALATSAQRLNPLNDFQQKNSDCDKKIQLSDFQTVKSQYTKQSIRDKILPNLIGYQRQTYEIGLTTQNQNLINFQDQNTKRDSQIVFDSVAKDPTLHGLGQIIILKGKTFDVPNQIGDQYRKRLQNVKFQSQASLRRTAEKEGQLKEQQKSTQPNWDQLDNIQDLSQRSPIDFQKYLKGQGDFQKDYPQLTTQVRLLTIEDPERLLQESNGEARLLPVVAVHTIYQYTKILYSKTVLGKTIQVKFYGKCQLIISTLPSKHQIYCFGQIIYKVFSVTKTKTIFSFKKLVATNWSWSQSWGGSWGFSFAVPLPPPVSFITINFYVTVGFKINLGLSSIVKQWWYPLIHEVKAVASTQLWADAKATLKVVAVEGGVFIKGTIVKVSTDPTVTLYYYLKTIHRLIIFWIKWYWEILAFKFEWGFIWRYWFFGWSSWKTIAKWTINGVYGKYKILNKVFWVHY